jgi:hypothetical protein
MGTPVLMPTSCAANFLSERPLKQVEGNLPGDPDAEHLDGQQVIGGDEVGNLWSVTAAGQQVEEAPGVAGHRPGWPVSAEVGAKVGKRARIVGDGEQLRMGRRLRHGW